MFDYLDKGEPGFERESSRGDHYPASLCANGTLACWGNQSDMVFKNGL